MDVANKRLFTSTVMNANLTSEAIPLPNIYGFAIQAVFTGTPTGTFKLQASSDPFKYANAAQPQVPTNWTDIADSSAPVSAAGNYMWNFNGCFFEFVRLVYTDGSSGASTAVLNATINLKGV